MVKACNFDDKYVNLVMFGFACYIGSLLPLVRGLRIKSSFPLFSLSGV